MRVALVVTGGVDRTATTRVIPSLLSLVARLARAHDLHVYVLRYHDTPCSYPLLGATVHDLGRPRGVARQYLALTRALRRDGPFDVLHAMWAMPAGLVSGMAGKRLGVPVVLTADSGEFVALPGIGYGLQRTWRHRAAVAAAIRLATVVTVCTHYMERLALQVGCAPEIVPIGADRSIFGLPDDVESSSPPEGPPWRLLHVASLSAVKDQETLLRATRFAADRGPRGSIRLDIVGEDTVNGRVQELARELGIDDVVTFHGVRPTPDIVAFYRAAHLFVLSSRHEAASAVVLEASLAGVPVVATRVGYVSDWPADRAAGVPVGDSEALGAEILALLDDRPRRDAMRAEARWWAEKYDADWTAARFDALYRTHVTSRPAG